MLGGFFAVNLTEKDVITASPMFTLCYLQILFQAEVNIGKLKDPVLIGTINSTMDMGVTIR